MPDSRSILIAAAAVLLSACASTGAIGQRSLRSSSADSARHEAGCVDDGGFESGYNIPVCRVTNDPSLWPR